MCSQADRPAFRNAEGLSADSVGMVADIGLPDFEHRVAILKQKAQLDRLELTIPML